MDQADSIPVRLANFEFDPLAAGGLAAVLPEGQAAAAGAALAGGGYYLVQFDGPITSDRLAALEGAGAAVFDYVPDFTFIVRMDPAQRSAVEGQSGVRWIGPYLPAFRLSRDILASSVAAEGAALPATATGDGKQSIPMTRTSPEIMVDLFPGEPAAGVEAAIERWGGSVSDRSTNEWGTKLKVSVAADYLAELAALQGVRWIEAAPQWKLDNNKAADAMGVRSVWNAQALRGAGQVVAVADTGLDTGSTAPAQLHDDFENGGGASRVSVIYDRVGDGGSDVNSGHGTHVAGSVLGNGSRSGSTPASHTYPATSYAGVAPEATLVFQAVENNSSGALSGIPADLNQLFSQAEGAGAKIHTNSWGSATAGIYTDNAAEVDQYSWNHKDFTILFAAGNEGVDQNGDGVIDRYSIGSPASAKNAITVGASENNRPSGSSPTPGYNTPWGTGSWLRVYPANPVRDDHVSNNINGMAAFSSRGPTVDGRIKPDIVAPGTNIISTFSSLAQPNENWGAVNAYYVYQGGTSMATPLTAGATALVRQFYTDVKHVTPSAALLKATLANGATNMAPGQYGTGATQEIGNVRPTSAAGWGRVNLENSLFPTSPRVMQYADEKAGLTTGGSKTFSYDVTSSAQPLRVSLAWTDYPGSAAAGGGLVDDLDLQVVAPGGTTYYPNNANSRAPVQQLSYNNGFGTADNYWSAGKRVAVRFTPTSYPADLQLARMLIGAKLTSDFPKTFNWYVWSGTASGPTTQLATGTATIRDYAWLTLDLASKNIRINSGDFFVGFQLPDANMVWATDGSAPVDGRSWDFDGSSWANWTQDDYMIDAVMTGTIPSTPHDRVNNLQGIDIASPAVGNYKIIVSGYNVPRGPQPYALVVSGAIKAPPPPVLGYKRFLPLVQYQLPPLPDAPALNPIDNAGNDGNYTVTWNVARFATGYTLEEGTDPSFSAPSTVYDGPNLNWTTTGHTPGTFFYRVRAKNTAGNGGWSNTQSVTVANLNLPTRLNSAADATVLSSAGGTNYGAFSDMLAGYNDCITSPPPGVFRSLVKFDLSAIPANTPITSARLSVYLIESCDFPDRTRTVTPYRAGASWSETGVTWSSQPPIGESYGSVDVPSRIWQRYSMDVTGLVRGWINGSFPNNGLVLRSVETVSSDSGSVGFGTREGSATYIPYLDITYPGGSPAVTAEQPVAPASCGNTVFELFAKSDTAKSSRGCVTP